MPRVGDDVEIARGTADVNQFARPAFSPDGSQVAFITDLRGLPRTGG